MKRWMCKFFRRRNMPITTWTQRDGTVIDIKEMSLPHLRNSIRMMERNGFMSYSTWAFYLFGPRPHGDGAIDAFEQEMDRVLSKEPSRLIDALQEEVDRRLEKINKGKNRGGRR